MLTALFLTIISIYLLVALYFASKNNWKTIAFFLIAVTFQNIIEIIFAPYVSSALIKIFSIIKELMLYSALGIIILRRNKIRLRAKSIWAFAYILFVLLNTIKSSASFYAIVISLRFLLMPVICILIGEYLDIDLYGLKKIYHWILATSTFLAFTGIWGLAFNRNNELWDRLHYADFATNIKGNTTETLINHVTVNFYTWDFGGVPFKRLISITADPLAAAFLIYLGAALVLTGCVRINASRGKINKNALTFVFLLLCAILSLSKAIFIFIILTILLRIYFSGKIPKEITHTILVVIFAIGIFIVALIAGSDAYNSSSIHVSALMNGFISSSFLGNGLGTAGATMQMLSGEEADVGDSFIGALTVQVGYLGLISFCLYLLVILNDIRMQWKRHHTDILLLAMIILTGLSVCMLFSESAVSIMGTGIYFMMIGIAENTSEGISKCDGRNYSG